MPFSSDYHFHKFENKHQTYFSEKSIWWSNTLKKWMCTNPTLITQILNDSKFGVHSYQITALAQKLNTDFSYIAKLVECFPLGFEGETHKEMRKISAQKLAERMTGTLDTFRTEIRSRIKIYTQNSNAVELYGTLIEPSVKRSLLYMADLESLYEYSIISISQLFDQAISINKRLKIDAQIATLIKAIADNLDEEEKYFRLSAFAIGYDSILGSLTESLVRTLQQNTNKKINQIVWSEELPNTGVPVIERVAKCNIDINNATIKTGQKIRLYLEAAGYQNSENSVYNNLFFGSGIHKCVGLHLSNAMWKVFIQELAEINRHIEIDQLHYRTEDYVFNIFDEIKVRLYD
jgi:hypothetical protein